MVGVVEVFGVVGVFERVCWRNGFARFGGWL